MKEQKHVLTLVERAATAKSSLEALQFSQGASNAANALLALATLQKDLEGTRPMAGFGSK